MGSGVDLDAGPNVGETASGEALLQSFWPEQRHPLLVHQPAHSAPGWMSDYTLGPELKPTTTIEGVCERRGVALPNECASHYGSDMCARRDATTRARGTLTINHLEARTPRSSASSKCHLLRLRDFAQQLHPSTACCAEPPQEGGNAARKCARPRK